MKKLLRKFRKKSDVAPSRITNDTVAEHRERILAGGRRFKYPIQYARHRLVFNAILISIVTLILLLALGWWQLYSVQNTTDFIYRVAKVLNLPVASVDGQPALYSDYLMKYRSSIHYLEQKEQVSLKTDDGKRQIAFIKQKAIEDTVADTYAIKLAKQLQVSVTDSELETFLKLQRQSSNGEVSQQTYDAVVLDYYNWSPDEYRYATKNKLLRQKVEYAVDQSATKESDVIAAQLTSGGVDMKLVTDAATATGTAKVVYGASGWVPKTNQDGGLALEASKLQKLQISPSIKSTMGDGYYFVRLVDTKDTLVSYEYIHIPLTTFADNLLSLEKDGKVKQYINVPKTVPTQ